MLRRVMWSGVAAPPRTCTVWWMAFRTSRGYPEVHTLQGAGRHGEYIG